MFRLILVRSASCATLLVMNSNNPTPRAFALCGKIYQRLTITLNTPAVYSLLTIHGLDFG